MFANILAAALRNLARNRLYAAISILGLAVAFAAAILIAQFVRNEFSYDRWIAGYQQVYKITDLLEQSGQPPSVSDLTQSPLAAQLRLALPTAAVARLKEGAVTLRYRPSDAGFSERAFAWADPDIFKVFPLPVLAGDLQSALREPDTVVITRNMARKYFGRDLPLGETLEVQIGKDRHPLRVTAVLQDLPSNTNLVTEVFASGKSAYSELAWLDAQNSQGLLTNFTYARLPLKKSAPDLQRALDIADRPEMAFYAGLDDGTKFHFHAVPIADLHLNPPGITDAVAKPAGSRTIAYAIAGVGALIVLVASINFVTLMTARAARRGLEVGVRKAAGARRGELMIQFMGEALFQVAVSAVIGASLAELLIRPFGAFVQRGLALDYVRDPLLTASVAGGALAVGLLASAYPALVLSGFRPAGVLKGGVAQTSGSPLARQTLVVIQFAILIGLIVTTATTYRQTTFALTQGVGTTSTPIITVRTPCQNAFSDEVRRLPGVSAAACTSLNALNTPALRNTLPVQAGGRHMSFDMAPVDFGFFELYGIRPLAGRLFSPAHGEDGVLAQLETPAQPSVIINETAARRLGFPDPRAAIGRPLMWGRPGKAGLKTVASEIVGVVPDMPMTVRAATDPTFYFVVPKRLDVLSIRLTGSDVPQTIKAIEASWKRTGNNQAIQETFLSQSRLDLYLDLIIQGVTIAVCAGLAILIACLGLFALSAYTTERRTKEIGIRKAMGASTRDVVRLLVWQFTVPVLWAIAIALPVSFLVMDHWLRQFAYRVDLPLWTFVLAAVTALAIAWITVVHQSWMAARAKPVNTLRYD